MDSYKEGLSEALDLTGAQKLALLNYNEQFKPKQPQVDKPTKDTLSEYERKQKIMAIKDDSKRQHTIAENIELFQ